MDYSHIPSPGLNSYFNWKFLSFDSLHPSLPTAHPSNLFSVSVSWVFCFVLFQIQCINETKNLRCPYPVQKILHILKYLCFLVMNCCWISSITTKIGQKQNWNQFLKNSFFTSNLPAYNSQPRGRLLNQEDTEQDKILDTGEWRLIIPQWSKCLELQRPNGPSDRICRINAVSLNITSHTGLSSLMLGRYPLI